MNSTSSLNPTPSIASFLDGVTVVILTYNEAPNVSRTLDALVRFPEVVVLDSGSTDETISIAERYANVRIATRPFDQHAAQWNYGLTSCGINRPWILALDADYVLTPALIDEIARLPVDAVIDGYRANFVYCIHGRCLSATLYPAHVVLFRRKRAHFVQEGHTQRVIVEGQVADMEGHIEHDDRKPLSSWLQAQNRYARLEADHLLSSPPETLRRSDRLRRMGWPAPIIVPLYMLFFKRCLLDGLPGWLYVLQRTLAEIAIALEINDRKLRGRSNQCRGHSDDGS